MAGLIGEYSGSGGQEGWVVHQECRAAQVGAYANAKSGNFQYI